VTLQVTLNLFVLELRAGKGDGQFICIQKQYYL